MATLKIYWVDPGTLHANPKNPRLIKNKDFKQLVKDISEFPKMLEIRPIVHDENLMILGGEKRWRACLELQLKKVPVINAKDLTEEEKRRFILKDNTHAGSFDAQILGEGWGDDELKEWGLDDLKKMKVDPQQEGDVEFSEELDEESNYIVLKFHKDIDWLQIETQFGLAKTHSKRQNGKPWSKGVGRVVDGMKAIKKLQEMHNH